MSLRSKIERLEGRMLPKADEKAWRRIVLHEGEPLPADLVGGETNLIVRRIVSPQRDAR